MGREEDRSLAKHKAKERGGEEKVKKNPEPNPACAVTVPKSRWRMGATSRVVKK